MAEEKVVDVKVTTGNNDLLMKAVVIYLLAPIGGLFFMNDADAFIKFNAKQSLYYGIALVILYVVIGAVTFGCGTVVVAIAHIVLVIYMVMKMKDGVKVKLPVIGDMAEK